MRTCGSFLFAAGDTEAQKNTVWPCTCLGDFLLCAGHPDCHAVDGPDYFNSNAKCGASFWKAWHALVCSSLMLSGVSFWLVRKGLESSLAKDKGVALLEPPRSAQDIWRDRCSRVSCNALCTLQNPRAPWPSGIWSCTVPLSVHLKTQGGPTQTSGVPFENTQPLFSGLTHNLPTPLGNSPSVECFLCRASPPLYVGAQFSGPLWLGELELLFCASLKDSSPAVPAIS